MDKDYESICIIGEIFNGYSELSVGDLSVFIKHPTIKDQRMIQKIYDEYYNTAVNKGIDTEKICIDRLVEDGLWVEEDELKIANLQGEISNLEDSIKNIVLPSQKKKVNEDITEKRQKLHALLGKRSELIGLTAEYFASKRSNEEFIRMLIFKDKDFKELMYSEQSFDQEEDDVLKTVLNINTENNRKFEDDSLQKIVLSPEFSLYINHTESPKDFFGKAVCDLSIYQLKLSAYGALFNSIFKNVPDIPNNIRKDPAALLQFAENRNDSSKSSIRKNDKGGATAVFGATKEDLEILDPEARKVDLGKMIKEKGGMLNMEQMMEMMG